MNTGQMMLSIAALGLLAFIFLNSNKTNLETIDSVGTSKGIITANSLALSLLDEISTKAYDEVTIAGPSIISANDFSSSLQPEGESYPNFDDVDDYNNFTKIENVREIGNFKLKVKVEYITDNLQKTSLKTYNKNVTVTVKGTALKNQTTGKEDSLVVSEVLSQWKML